MQTQGLMRDVLHLKIQLEDERRKRHEAEERYESLRQHYTNKHRAGQAQSEKLSNGTLTAIASQDSAPADRQEDELLPVRLAVAERVIFTLLEEIRLLKLDLRAALFQEDCEEQKVIAAVQNRSCDPLGTI
jgi:hypothetical protein